MRKILSDNNSYEAVVVVGVDGNQAPSGTIVSSIDQTTPGTTDSVTVKATARMKSSAVARPANTTPYTAGDVKGATAAAFEITGLGAANEVVRITAATIKVNVAAVPSGMTYMTLKLYNAAPVSALADNAPWVATGDEAIYQRSVDFPNMTVFGGSIRAELNDLAIDVKLSSTGSLFGYLVTAGAFTPTSGAITTVDLYTIGG